MESNSENLAPAAQVASDPADHDDHIYSSLLNDSTILRRDLRCIGDIQKQLQLFHDDALLGIINVSPQSISKLEDMRKLLKTINSKLNTVMSRLDQLDLYLDEEDDDSDEEGDEEVVQPEVEEQQVQGPPTRRTRSENAQRDNHVAGSTKVTKFLVCPECNAKAKGTTAWSSTYRNDPQSVSHAVHKALQQQLESKDSLIVELRSQVEALTAELHSPLTEVENKLESATSRDSTWLKEKRKTALRHVKAAQKRVERRAKSIAEGARQTKAER